MPTYEYACKSCGEHLEVVQSFKDDALTTCPACSGQLRKVFGSIGIAFKGSGFYKTDSRSAASASNGSAAAPAKASASSDSSGSAPSESSSSKPTASTPPSSGSPSPSTAAAS